MKQKLKWVDDNLDSLCPICKQDTLEYLIDDNGDETIHKERCRNGCYIYNFDTKKREK